MAVLSLESLPLGFRFRPTDEELVNHYLRLKINGRDSDVGVIPEIDVCKWEPWDLPDLSVIKTDDPEWFFFCPRDRKYPNGSRSNRATEAGYWKATGKDRNIKSRLNLIGMKKTLVFYKGRAPKGERTNWIMHEYRATEKNLDGTNPGQAAFVLCRLFRKSDDRVEISNCDEIEPTGSSPTATKSSPDEIPSSLALGQATPESDVHDAKQPAGIERWLADNSDNITSDALVPAESNCTSNMASDMEDHDQDGATTEVDLQFEEELRLFCDQNINEPLLDWKVFSPLPSEMYPGLGLPYMNSAFADGVVNNSNGMVFQDGTSEQDVSISDFLDAVINNQDEYSFEESNGLKSSAVKSEAIAGTVTPQPIYDDGSGRVSVFFAGGSQKECGSSSDTDTEVAQNQKPQQDDFSVLPDSAMYCGFQGSSANSIQGPAIQRNPVETDGDRIGGTGIKLRTRQAQYQLASHNSSTQGTAPRRIHLQTQFTRRATSCTKPMVSSSEEENENEVSSEVEASDYVDHSGIAEELNAKICLRPRRDSVKAGKQWWLFPVLVGRSNSSAVYIVCVFMLILVTVVCVSVWGRLTL